MLETLGNHPESERLHACNGFVPILAVCHDTGQRRYFGKPAAVNFAFDFNRERHPGNVPFGPAV